ncbi:MAG: isochorismatase family cysteine hydrolase [Opitutaceae bacterium]|jgi:nicotinamidase-related amidase
MSTWRIAYRSFYYETMAGDDLPEVVLPVANTALLVIDLQVCYLPASTPPNATPSDVAEWQRWAPFRDRLHETVLPATQRLLARFRQLERDVLFARIACLTKDGRDRSLSQARPGFNNLLLPLTAADSQILPQIAPLPHEIVVTKTTDSALTGTNLRLILTNLGIRNVVVCGIFTDQCVASTVRSLADESFNVIVVDDACAAATDELHRAELTIINNIYCQVLTTDETLAALRP